MKFFLAMLVYALTALLLAYGILLTIHGNPWLLIAGLLGYLIALVKIGCLPKKSH